MSQRQQRGHAGDKTICLPLAQEQDYEGLVKDTRGFRTYLNQMITKYPELFPPRYQ